MLETWRGWGTYMVKGQSAKFSFYLRDLHVIVSEMEEREGLHIFKNQAHCCSYYFVSDVIIVIINISNCYNFLIIFSDICMKKNNIALIYGSINFESVLWTIVPNLQTGCRKSKARTFPTVQLFGVCVKGCSKGETATLLDIWSGLFYLVHLCPDCRTNRSPPDT